MAIMRMEWLIPISENNIPQFTPLPITDVNLFDMARKPWITRLKNYLQFTSSHNHKIKGTKGEAS